MKKIIGLILGFALAAQVFPADIFAAAGDSVSIIAAKKLRAGMSLKASAVPANNQFSFQWLESDREDGEFTPIYTAQSEEYMLTTLDEGKYIKLKAVNVADSQEITAEEIKKLDSLGPISKTTFTETEVSAARSTPAQNTFYIGERSFILIDEFNADQSRYYVMSDEFYGSKAFDSNGYAGFDTESEGNIGYFLNNEFLIQGNGGKVFPQKILEHIHYDHVWWTEAGAANGDCPSDYSFKAGVSLMSESEVMKYYGVFGWQPAQTTGSWWLRTQRGVSPVIDDNIFIMNGASESEKGNTADVLCTTEHFIRPVFFLDHSFFSDTKLNTAKVGSKIVNILKKNYSLDTLKKLYTMEELEQMGILKKEFALTIETQKVAELNNEIRLQAKPEILIQDEVSAFSYQWLYKNFAEDAYKPIYKATGETYYISTEDIGKTISVEMTPVMTDGTVKDTLASASSYEVKTIGMVDRTALTSEQRQAMKTTPPENTFTVDGMKFILLNEFQDENSAFYIMAEDLYGKRAFDPDKTQKFDVKDENNIGYFLNNEFVTQGSSGKILPQSILSHIDFSHLWWTESGHANGNCPADYSFTAGISLISKTEYGKYREKIGWNTSSEWWSRTTRAKNGSGTNVMAMVVGTSSSAGDLWGREAELTSVAIRPVFFLNHSFFADVKVTDIGANVAKAMSDHYSLSALLNGKAGYTVSELEQLGILQIPQADLVTIGGNTLVNAFLKGSYQYIHPDNMPEVNSSFGFEISADNKTFTICAADTLTYQAKQADSGLYIRFYCQPRAADGVSGDKKVSRSVMISSQQDISITKMSVKEAEDGLAFSQMTTITPHISITNYSKNDRSAVCVIAAYNEKDQLKQTGIRTVNIKAEGETEIDDFSIPLTGSYHYARVFVVDSILNMNSVLGYEVVLR